MEIKNIFLYWVGKEYTLISILRDLIYLHSSNGNNYKVHLITNTNINEYVQNLPRCFGKLCPAHQADFVRVNVVCDYGGIWLDSDTLVLDDLHSLFEYLETKNGFFLKENNVLCNGVFGSKPKTPLMMEWKKRLCQMLDTNTRNRIGWTELGSRTMQDIYRKCPGLYDNYVIFNGSENLYPIFWRDCLDEFVHKPYDNYKNITRDWQPLIVLVNSVYKNLEEKSKDDIINGNMPLNYFIRKSIENKQISNEQISNKQISNKQISNKQIFENIYAAQLWNNCNSKIPLSGPGSSIKNTINYATCLTKFIYENKCKSVMDLGCGDLTWIQKTQFFNDPLITYTGIDVVEALIVSHKRNFPEKQFLCEDITLNIDVGADMVIIRDVLFHLSNDEIIKIFSNIKNKFKFVIITTCKNMLNTDNFDKWHFSPKNIHIDPFNKSNNFVLKIDEPVFNRYALIYDHEKFYA